MVNLTINDIKVSVPEGTTILNAAKKVNINIPTLCYLDLHDIKMVNRTSSCRVCLVEIEGRRNLAPSCSTEAFEGMIVRTNSARAIKARRTMVELLLSDHPTDCLVCEKNTQCQLQLIAAELGIRKIRYKGAMSNYKKDSSSGALYRNLDKCIMCRRCETMCNEVQTCQVYSAVDRGFETVVSPAFGRPMVDTQCTFCGQCVSVCPTAALTQVSNVAKVWEVLTDPDKYVVVQTAPAIRVTLGEKFGMEPGTIVTGKMVAALRRLGFDKVCDTDFAADVTILEEAHEFIDRLQNGGRLPILTSCCPSWVKFIEHQFPDLLDIPSTCKSPHIMFGTLAKTYMAEKLNIDPSKIVVVSVMPCIAKKYEISRKELQYEGHKNVDLVVTTRELADMIMEAGIDFNKLPDEDFDNPLGESTGASVIFGTTGGVIEAALRTAYEWITGETLKEVEFHSVRGLDGLKEASINIGGKKINIGVAHGLGNARKLLEEIESGESKYHAIEIMACPGGCIDGGGQPYHFGDLDIVKKRMEALYREDRNKPLRKSHENPEVQALYKEFIGDVGGKKAHDLLHTHYIKRQKL
ncbi:NADH-dependent [FeFe] hydrogenase, group A6 [Clostridium autoethanogenum]|uniref:NADH-dependent [FeFe] hydrogenase, group A6 n=1 Tax=Clostridium autoethanogenum DSM 10061 TaxID=1341692 RepID=A0ABN4BJ56_9CLOT|nr:NADH-dependent [FeFe] hydrogenase, group A6 [Clostridium autoethanogenum]AGY77772.1 NADH-dependent [FeFe] hydrogenase, group A6 [Clostridium autoethanogenum DSM 10061]ALU37907.1 NADH ubiquinone oxidoreductase [Clostridium autoethanogenum DSM 10061]OVY49742.1 NADP-reducing hydrogenase subunit HndC [Clostridium autoethanogenum]